MANGVNKVILVGNLGKDPEIHKMDNGVTKASFSLATTETYKDKSGEKVSTTEWHNIVLWRGLAEVAENYLKKGQTVYVEGKIRKREYEDKEGQKKSVVEIIGDSLVMMGGGNKEEGQQQQPAQQQRGTSSSNNSSGVDDLPF